MSFARFTIRQITGPQKGESWVIEPGEKNGDQLEAKLRELFRERPGQRFRITDEDLDPDRLAIEASMAK